MIFKAHLKKTSGRAIKYKELSVEESRRADDEAVRRLDVSRPQGEDLAKLQRLIWEERIFSMLVGVSKKSGLTEKQFLELGEGDWTELNPAVLAKDGPLNFETLFPSIKEQATIRGIYQRLHEVSTEDLDEIMGKAVPVAESTG